MANSLGHGLLSVFFDISDGAHWALFHAVATGNASFLIHYCCNIPNDVQDILWAGIHTDTTTGALVSIDNWMRHEALPSRSLLFSKQRVVLSA